MRKEDFSAARWRRKARSGASTPSRQQSTAESSRSPSPSPPQPYQRNLALSKLNRALIQSSVVGMKGGRVLRQTAPSMTGPRWNAAPPRPPDDTPTLSPAKRAGQTSTPTPTNTAAATTNPSSATTTTSSSSNTASVAVSCVGSPGPAVASSAWYKEPPLRRGAGGGAANVSHRANTQWGHTTGHGANKLNTDAAVQRFAEMMGGRNAGMAIWIQQRLAQRDKVDNMGLTIEWLQSKTRDPLEEEALQRLLKERRVEGGASADAVAGAHPRRRRNSLVARTYDGNDAARITLPSKKRSSSDAGRDVSGKAKTTKANAEHLADSYFAGMANTTGLSRNDGLKHLRMYVRRNRWRLHHLFLSAGLATDYKMEVDEIAELLETVGGLVKVVPAKLESVEYTQAKDSDGTLQPLTPTALRVLLGTYGLDRNGQLDYRRVLDDYMGESILEHRLRMDRVRKRQQANNQRTRGPVFRSVHDEIGRSIAETQNPYTWLVEEQKAQDRVNQYQAGARPRPKSPPRDLIPLEKGWLGICKCPGMHHGRCPGFNRGKGNPFLEKWYAQHEEHTKKHTEAAAAAEADLEAKLAAKMEKLQPVTFNDQSEEHGYASLTTSMSLPEGFSQQDFANFRKKQWGGFLQAKSTMEMLGQQFNERKLMTSRVAPKEFAYEEGGWKWSAPKQAL